MTAPAVDVLVAVVKASATVYVRIVGRGTFDHGPTFSRLIDRFRRSPRIYVVVDLAECVLLQSTFLGLHAELGRICARIGRLVVLANAAPGIGDAFRTLAIARLFTFGAVAVPSLGWTKITPPARVGVRERAETAKRGHMILAAASPNNADRQNTVSELDADLRALGSVGQEARYAGGPAQRVSLTSATWDTRVSSSCSAPGGVLAGHRPAYLRGVADGGTTGEAGVAQVRLGSAEQRRTTRRMASTGQTWLPGDLRRASAFGPPRTPPAALAIANSLADCRTATIGGKPPRAGRIHAGTGKPKRGGEYATVPFCFAGAVTGAWGTRIYWVGEVTVPIRREQLGKQEREVRQVKSVPLDRY